MLNWITPLIVVLAGILLFTGHIPYRLTSTDVYQQMADIKAFDYSTTNPTNPYFHGGHVDLHTGPYYFALYLVKTVTGSSIYDLVLVIALLNIVVVIGSLMFFARSLHLTQVQQTYFVLLCLFGWGSYVYWAGIFSFTNLLVTGSYPATVGFCSILVCTSIGRLLLERGEIKWAICLVALISPLMISHLLSGIILIAFLCLALFENVLRTRAVSRATYMLAVAIATSLILSIFIWPLFGLLTLLLSVKTVQSGDGPANNLFALQYWPALMGFILSGGLALPLLVKRKQYFIILFLLFTVGMTCSYLLPIHVALYWRFFPFVFLAFALCLSIFLTALPKWISMSALGLLLLNGIIADFNRLNFLYSRPLTRADELHTLIAPIPPCPSQVFRPL